MGVVIGPEQHANTEAFKQWALAEARPDAEWVITRKDARELVALAARADTLERERVVERAASVMAETERDVSDEASATWATLLAEAQIAADEGRAEADRLREALRYYADYDNWDWPAPGVEPDVISQDVGGNRARAALSAEEGTPA